MNEEEIVRFFEILAKTYKASCRIILTGAGAGALYGRIRATTDLDFALKIQANDAKTYEKDWKDFETAVKDVSLKTGIDTQYAEDIDRWSSITLLDYEKHTYLFKRFGKIEVRLLEPPYWAIGKFGRYLDSDVRDLIHVFQKTNIRWQVLSEILGKALNQTPKSTACFQFRKQVENFFNTHGKEVWGRDFTAEEAIRRFHQHAGITRLWRFRGA